MKGKITLILCLAFIVIKSNAQDYTGVVRGKIIDEDTRRPLPGVNVVIKTGEFFKGASTDLNGMYRVENVPIGRVNMQVSFLGYSPRTFLNLELTTGKELVVNAQLTERITQLQTVEVTSANEGELNNDAAVVSARSFSVEESMRFAGARNDVARMAGNFAGVNTSNDAVNDIVVRGNSPNGILWRLEDVDIFNPNHFGGAGATGGPVSMLNNNVLRNSDFFTGAFPSMYGNANAGVFDLKMRTGNNQKHEFLGQIGFNGFELGAEGPINKEKGSSYLMNYRYSALGLMDNIGFEVGTGTGVPFYQDLSFKFDFPQSKLGHVSVFGLAGKNSIEFINSKTNLDELGDDFYTDGDVDLINSNRMAVVGVTQTAFWNSNTYSKLVLSGQTSNSFVQRDSLTGAARTPVPNYGSDQDLHRTNAHFYVNHKRNAKNKFRVGVMADVFYANHKDSIFRSEPQTFRKLTDYDGTASLLRAYGNYRYLPAENLKFNLGIYSQYFTLNNAVTFEPRINGEWEFLPGKKLSFGAGVHNQTSPMNVYFRETPTSQGYVRTNENLNFTKSNHIVAGYGQSLGGGLQVKAEVYAQFIDRAPVQSRPTAYSLLNAGTFGTQIHDSLVNDGKGRNLGIDISVEKRMVKGTYFILNGSLYESEYRGSDGEWRNTAFNGNFLINGVGGKEFNLSGEAAKSNRKSLTADLKVTYAGGLRYTDIDLEASRAASQTVLQNDNPFSKQFNPYFRADIRVGYRVNYKKFTQEWALDIQNVTDTQNPFAATFDWRTGEENITNQLGIFPMLQYRITF